MNAQSQFKLIENWVSSRDVFKICRPVVKDYYFDPEWRETVQFILEYYDQYNDIPSPPLVEANTNVKITPLSISGAEVNYTIDALEQYCRRRAVEHAIYSAPEKIENGQYDIVEKALRDAVATSVRKSIGVSYFEDIASRYRDEESVEQFSTGWPEVDALIGNLERKTMTILTANSGGGKSIALKNITKALCSQKLDGMFISLELPLKKVLERFDSMYAGIPPVLLRQNAEIAIDRIKQQKATSGTFMVDRLPNGTSPNQLRAVIQEYYLINGKYPDFIAVDYMDCMSPDGYMGNSKFDEDKNIAEGLRELGEEYDCIIVTASQQNREAVAVTNTQHNHIAGGISKINTADNVISIIMTDAMRAQDEMIFKFLKTRYANGVGDSITMHWNSQILTIESNQGIAQSNRTSMIDSILNKSSSTAKKKLDAIDFDDDSCDGSQTLNTFLRNRRK